MFGFEAPLFFGRSFLKCPSLPHSKRTLLLDVLVSIVASLPILEVGHHFIASSRVFILVVITPLCSSIIPRLLIVGAKLGKLYFLLDFEDHSNFFFSLVPSFSISFSLIYISTFIALQITTFKVVSNFTVGP